MSYAWRFVPQLDCMMENVSLPPPDAIRHTAADVVARPYFDLGNAASREDWDSFFRLLRWLTRPLRALFDSMEGLPDFVRWLVVIACVAILIAIFVHIIFTLLKAIGGPIGRRDRAYSLPTIELKPEELESQAESSGARGDYIGAIRLLLRASLRRIELAEKRKLRPGFTNRELLRRYQSTPLQSSLARLVETVELKWYGSAPCEAADYQACQAEHARIRDYTRIHATAHNS